MYIEPEIAPQTPSKEGAAKAWTLDDFLKKLRPHVKEIFPWDLNDYLNGLDPQQEGPLLLDIREPAEYEAMHIDNSYLIPRGVLENAANPGYTESDETLMQARDREIIVLCRSGNRSILGAYTLALMGFQNVKSLKTGVRGWADAELPLYNGIGEYVTLEESEKYFYPE